jgi:2-polyprenyl-6-methoxyphenol hydroxylase-like FAD-dependent oxidoreductase
MAQRFLVVGGGIGGLAVALALASKGVKVDVLERSPEFAEVGAGLQLGPNASRMLDRLGILRVVHDTAVFPSRMTMCDIVDGHEISTLDLGAGFRARYGYPYIVMHRTDLHAALLAASSASPGISLSTRCDVVDLIDEGERVRAVCADGRVFVADAAVGADGLNSVVRRRLIDDGDPVDSRYVAYRGAIAMSEMSKHAGLDNVVLWTGHEFHLVQYPVRRGELYNQVAVFRVPEGTTEEDQDQISAELDRRFASACEHVRNALPTVGRTRRWRLFDREPARGWARGRIVLLGDAAHPMLQYLAQGACQALEDAVVLADQIELSPDDVVRAFVGYEALRAPRTARVQKNARIFGEVIHADVTGQLLRDALLRHSEPGDIRYVNWLYGQNVADPAMLPIG